MKRICVLLASLLLASTTIAASQWRPRLLGAVVADALFDPSVVHDVRLSISTRDWQTLKDHYLENTYYPADFRWRDQVVRNVGIRSRGTGSRSPVKPGLGVSFSRYTKDQKLLGLDAIVLRNNTQDASNMHERLAMQLFTRLGVPISREAYAKLYINDEYAGLYTIVESVDPAFLRRVFDGDDGYLFDFDSPIGAASYYLEPRGSDPSAYVPFPFKPQTRENDPQPEIVMRMIEAINNSSDAAFRAAIDEYLDLNAFVRQAAIDQYLQDDDGLLGNWGINNFYLYRSAASNRFTFIPWDKSDAFLFGFGRSIWHNIRGVDESQQNRLMRRAITYPDVLALYLDTLEACIESAQRVEAGAADRRGWLEQEIEREYEQIRDAALADPVKPYSNAEFEAAVETLRVFARHRAENVSREVARAR